MKRSFFTRSIFGPLLLAFCLSGFQSFSPSKKTSEIRGIIIAGSQAEVSSSMSTRLADVPFEMGDTFQKDDVLIEFQCDRLKAEYSALRAAQKALALREKSNKELFDNGAAGALELATSSAEQQKAAAEARAKAVDIKECIIKAPYNGSIAARYVDPFETPAAGTPLLKIIDNSALEIKLIAPSKWLAWLSVDDAFTFTIDETGTSYNAKIIRISSAVDSVSQTVDLNAQFTVETPKILAGMSGRASFTNEQE